MGTNYNPKIVTDGLVLAVDAANVKSYPGSGTTWSDLSKSGNHGTLTNTTFSPTPQRFQFNGTTSFVDVGNSASLKTPNITVSCWLKFSSFSADLRLLSDWHQNAASGDRWIFYCPSSSNVQWYIYAGGSAVGMVYNNPPTGVWLNLVGTYNGIITAFYANNTLIQSAAKTGDMVAGTGGSVRIGKQAETGTFFNGEIANVTIYNRGLTAEEVSQNFNATRGRFGL